MAWNLSTLQWVVFAIIAGGLGLAGLTRPWRFFQVRRHCPQCRTLLPRWGRWGWKDDWTCPRCGCQIGG